MSDHATLNINQTTRPYQPANNGHDAAQPAVEAIKRTKAAADTARDLMHRAADQGRETVQHGLRVMAEAQTPLAELSAEGSRRLVEAAAGVTEVYRSVAERNADDVQAFIGALSIAGRGFQQYQQAYLGLLGQSVRSMAGKRQDLFRAKSPVAFAELQRDIYIDGVNSMFAGVTTLLQLAGKIAEDTVRPLNERAQKQA